MRQTGTLKEKIMKLGLWKKPGTDEIRVYFNGVHAEAKVFAVQNGTMYDIRVSVRMYPSQKDALMDSIERELEEMAGKDVRRWDDLLALAEK
jgi:hypothetical protein